MERTQRRTTLLKLTDDCLRGVLQEFVDSIKATSASAIPVRPCDVQRVRNSLLSDADLNDVLHSILGASSGSGAEVGLERRQLRVDKFIGLFFCTTSGSQRLGSLGAEAEQTSFEKANYSTGRSMQAGASSAVKHVVAETPVAALQ